MASEEIVKNLLNHNRHRNVERDTDKTAPRTSPQNRTRASRASVAHRISMIFKDDKQKFSGERNEYINDFIANHNQAAIDYELSPRQKLFLMHNRLRDDAKRFYQERIENCIDRFSEAVKALNNEFNSVVR